MPISKSKAPPVSPNLPLLRGIAKSSGSRSPAALSLKVEENRVRTGDPPVRPEPSDVPGS